MTTHQQNPDDHTIRGRAAERANTADSGVGPRLDPGLRRLMKWVFGALVLTVIFAILVVELTLRWFNP
jgi:hypothetical protein